MVVDAGVSGGVKPENRPGLGAASSVWPLGKPAPSCPAPSTGWAGSALGVLPLVKRAKAEGWVLLVNGVPDISTPTGEFVFTVMSGVAQLERRLIRQRITAALQAKKAQGARLDQPHGLDRGLLEDIDRRHWAGNR